MDWQERLRRLDGRLAAEEISMAEYRKLRDEILAEASGGAPRSVPRPAGDWTAANPGAEPSRVHIPISAALDSPSGEMTQIVGDDDPTITVSTTQATAAPAKPDNPKQGNGTELSESTRTEAVESPKPPPNAPQMPMPAAKPNPAMPPILQPAPPPAPGPAWSPPVRGETVFATNATRPTNTGRTVLLIIAVVVLLAALGAGAWWLLRGDRPGTAGGNPPAAQPAAMSLERLPSPAGALLSTTGVVTVDQAKTLNLISEAEAGYLNEVGTEKVFFRAVADGGLTYHVFMYQTGDDSRGHALVTSMTALDKKNGMADAGIAELPAGVTARIARGPSTVVVVAGYPTDGGAVRLVVAQNGQPDEPRLTDAIRKAVELSARSIPVR